MITFFWMLPIWWSSNSESIARLDKDLGLSFNDRWPAEIQGAAAIQLDQRDAKHLGISVLRDDGHHVEGVSGMTFARVSPKLQDRARDFECRNGRIEFGYAIDRGEAPAYAFNIQVSRGSDGALLVRVRKFNVGPSLLIIAPSLMWWTTWHRYEPVPDTETAPDPSEASHQHVDAR
jgi:hypothetical protein